MKRFFKNKINIFKVFAWLLISVLTIQLLPVKAGGVGEDYRIDILLADDKGAPISPTHEFKPNDTVHFRMEYHLKDHYKLEDMIWRIDIPEQIGVLGDIDGN